ncbi:MAG: bifunctional riboflavin kinase/FAD synthetase [Eubacteriales bacterium]|nr:bifunctional riboflavin kinase/FAD synthetase [Eubacteriales bacterium]
MAELTPAVVALGMFDGVHLGHRALIERAVDEAKRRNAKPVVFTFSNHPMEVLGGGVRLLSSIPERDRILCALGIREVASVPFTRELAALSTEQFAELLLGRWRVRSLIVGYNYTCGAHGAGTPETLAQIGQERGFSVIVVPPVLFEGAPVSSTRVREALERGEAERTEQMLKRRYTLSGTIVENRRIGRRIGFPTANIEAQPNRVIPKDGVYATYACVDGAYYRAVTNIGTNPTVHGDRLTIETHLIGLDADLYGKRLTVAFRHYLRGELVFSSLDALKEQIRLDIAEADAR